MSNFKYFNKSTITSFRRPQRKPDTKPFGDRTFTFPLKYSSQKLIREAREINMKTIAGRRDKSTCQVGIKSSRPSLGHSVSPLLRIMDHRSCASCFQPSLLRLGLLAPALFVAAIQLFIQRLQFLVFYFTGQFDTSLC